MVFHWTGQRRHSIINVLPNDTQPVNNPLPDDNMQNNIYGIHRKWRWYQNIITELNILQREIYKFKRILQKLSIETSWLQTYLYGFQRASLLKSDCLVTCQYRYARIYGLVISSQPFSTGDTVKHI